MSKKDTIKTESEVYKMVKLAQPKPGGFVLKRKSNSDKKKSTVKNDWVIIEKHAKEFRENNLKKE